MMTPYGFHTEEIKEISRKAGKAILEVYQTNFKESLVFKDDNSPLTLADKKSHSIIESGLKSLSIKYPIISEEADIPIYEIRKSWDLFWMIDPLDGTKEFVNRNGDFTVNIALVNREKVVFGCILIPVTGECYWGLQGEGSYLEKEEGIFPLKVNEFIAEDKNLKILGSRSHMNKKTIDYIKQFEEPEVIARGSSLKMMMIAEGRADIYPRFGPTMEWDTAASQIILEEAGGSMIQADGQGSLRYNKENLLNPSFIASAKKINK